MRQAAAPTERPKRYFYTEWGHVTLAELARHMKVPYTTLRWRIAHGHVSLKQAPQKDRVTHNPMYWVWADMHIRCRYPSHTAWKNYGGRGITVCSEWSDFRRFWADMGPTYQPGLTIERKDNDKGYCLDNCIWIPRSEQGKNRRANRYFDTPHGRMTLTDTARYYGLKEATLRHRLDSGLAFDVAIARPVRRKRSSS